MTAPVNTTPPTTSGAPISNAVVGGPMGKDQFIKLLVAQMTHQDPLKPLDGQEMAAQLAQFSSIEQLMNIGDKIDAQTASNTALLGVVNNSAAMNLLGRTVQVPLETLTVGDDTLKTVKVDVPAAGGTITLRLLNANGEVVRTIDAGFIAGGTQELDLEELTDGLPDGDYTLKVDCTQGGATTTLNPLASLVVDGVRFGPDGTVVTSGGRSYPVGLITSVSSGS